MSILAVNAGSSSLKFALYPAQAGDRIGAARVSGQIEGLESGGRPVLGWRVAPQDGAPGESRREPVAVAAGADPFGPALEALHRLLQGSLAGTPLRAVAHRVVHGGAWYRASVMVDDGVMARLESLNTLAPLHQPHNLEGIRSLQRAWPGVPQVACFDTAFHADLPEHEYLFALPRALGEQGIRRYGFHGLSYQYVQSRLRLRSARSEQRVVMAHLGNGASLCAMQGGRSTATTMGFSALDGLVMGTRCGALDPGVLLHLMDQGLGAPELTRLLYRESGLLGVSGIAADMRTLRASDSPDARRAIDLFTHRVVREAGAMAACIGGLDLLAFTGGIGEHDAALRQAVGDRLGHLGVAVDAAANRGADGQAMARIDAPGSAVEVWVVPTDEGRMAAQSAADLLQAPLAGSPGGPAVTPSGCCPP